MQGDAQRQADQRERHEDEIGGLTPVSGGGAQRITGHLSTTGML